MGAGPIQSHLRVPLLRHGQIGPPLSSATTYSSRIAHSCPRCRTNITHPRGRHRHIQRNPLLYTTTPVQHIHKDNHSHIIRARHKTTTVNKANRATTHSKATPNRAITLSRVACTTASNHRATTEREAEGRRAALWPRACVQVFAQVCAV